MNNITLSELKSDYERDYPSKISHNFPFHASIINNDLETFHTYIKNGYDLNKKDEQNNSPLMLAIVHKNREMIRTLLNAKVNIQERYNKFTSLSVACLYDLDNDLFLEILQRSNINGMKVPISAFNNDFYDFTFYLCLIKPSQSNETLNFLFQYKNGYIFNGIPDHEKAIKKLMSITPAHAAWYNSKMEEFGNFRNFQENFCKYTGHLYKGPFLNEDIKKSFSVLFFTIVIITGSYFSYEVIGPYGLSPFIFFAVLFLVALPTVFIMLFTFPFVATKSIVTRCYDYLFRKHLKPHKD